MSNSLQQRFSANFPSSSDLYGAAQRGGAGHDGSSYFGKSKFSMSSQQNTKNAHSVLRAIQEGPQEGGLLPNYLLESYECKESLGGLPGRQQDHAVLKHQSIHVIEKNQKQIRMKSKRFLNNSVHQKTSGMHIGLPQHRLAANGSQGGVGAAATANQSETHDSMIRNQADQIYRNLRSQISKYQ